MCSAEPVTPAPSYLDLERQRDTLWDEVIAARAKLAAAEARCASLERQRSGFDCRFAGPYAEMSGSHCPSGKPCQRCELEAAEARVAELEAYVRETAEHHAEQARAWGDNEFDGEADLNAQYHREREGIARRALAGGGK